jgi:beta-N-acetylhexosaminidase
VLGLAATVLVIASGGSSNSLAAPRSGQDASKRPANVPLTQLVGQHLMGRLTGTQPSASLLARIRRGELGGVIIFSENFTALAGLKTTIAKLQKAARNGGGPPLLIATDQEGGLVKRLPAGPPFKSPAEMGAAGSASQARLAGTDTGKYLRAASLNVDLAPVLDVPSSNSSFLGSRAFGRDPTRVQRVGVAFASGLQSGGVAATAKHFPGLGTAAANTDIGDVTIFNSRAELLRRLAPFKAAVRTRIKLVMVSNARYAALDPTKTPAALSKPIVTGLLRQQLGFRGVVITDTLAAPSLRRYRDVPMRALRAGIDVLLYSDREQDSADAYAQLVQAFKSGRLARDTLEASFKRVISLKSWLAIQAKA